MGQDEFVHVELSGNGKLFEIFAKFVEFENRCFFILNMYHTLCVEELENCTLQTKNMNDI